VFNDGTSLTLTELESREQRRLRSRACSHPLLSLHPPTERDEKQQVTSPSREREREREVDLATRKRHQQTHVERRMNNIIRFKDFHLENGSSQGPNLILVKSRPKSKPARPWLAQLFSFCSAAVRNARKKCHEQDAQGTPTQSHISPSILVYEDKATKKSHEQGGNGSCCNTQVRVAISTVT